MGTKIVSVEIVDEEFLKKHLFENNDLDVLEGETNE